MRYFELLSRDLELVSARQGYWPATWSKPEFGRGAQHASVLDDITVTGHHLEWIALMPDSLVPSLGRVGTAIEGILRRQLERHVFDRDLVYAPLSHLARALCLLRGEHPVDILDALWPKVES